MKQLAPIVLFVYNRPNHTLQTLEALSRNELASESDLYIYADAPKEGASDEDSALVGKVRQVIRSKPWCKEVIIKEARANKGLANSVIEGVTEIVNIHGRVIVLEDDILTSPFFLRFLNEGLEAYKDSHNVFSINSYMFPISTERLEVFLSPLGTTTWGWATWSDRWVAFEEVPDYKIEIQQNAFLRSRFNLAHYDYAKMLNNANSWGIRWYYSVFVRNGLGVFPTKTLSLNIGFDEQATHTKAIVKQMELHPGPIPMTLHTKIDFSLHVKLLEYFTRPNKKRSLWSRLFRTNTHRP